MHRLSRSKPTDAVWTASASEITRLKKSGYADQGGSFLAATTSDSYLVGVNALTRNGLHRQSADPATVSALLRAGWVSAGISFYVAPAKTTQPTAPVTTKPVTDLGLPTGPSGLDATGAASRTRTIRSPRGRSSSPRTATSQGRHPERAGADHQPGHRSGAQERHDRLSWRRLSRRLSHEVRVWQRDHRQGTHAAGLSAAGVRQRNPLPSDRHAGQGHRIQLLLRLVGPTAVRRGESGQSHHRVEQASDGPGVGRREPELDSRARVPPLRLLSARRRQRGGLRRRLRHGEELSLCRQRRYRAVLLLARRAQLGGPVGVHR